MWDQIEKLIKLSSQPLPDEVEVDRNPERRNYYRFLYHLVKWRQPAVALEIGVEAGFGSCYMAMAAKEYGGIVIGIDHEKKISVPMPDNFHFIEGDATHTKTWVSVQAIVNMYGRLGLVYQDSSHHYSESHTEWGLYSRLMANGGIWVCDDVTPAFHDPLLDPPGKGMVQYFEELPGEKRLYKDVLHFGNVQGIVIVNGR